MNLRRLMALCPGDARTVVAFASDPARPPTAALERFPAATVIVSPDIPPRITVDAAILVEPLPHSRVAEFRLKAAKNWISGHGCILAMFPAGRGGYAETGRDIVLSRAALEMETCAGADGCWCVLARPRACRISLYGRQRRQRYEAAMTLNAKGEALYGAGDMMGALTTFAEATELWNEEAVIYSNLATALHALGHKEQAYLRVREALYLDPFLPAARENLRAIAHDLGRTDEADEWLALFGSD